MSDYCDEIQKVVSTSLKELAEEQAQGKVIDAPVTNHNFLIRWVTKSIKQQRFAACVAKDLAAWQKEGRSKGNAVRLDTTFRRIREYYARMLNQVSITDQQIEELLDQASEQQWEVSTSEPLIDCGKVQLFTEGPNSLALCAHQCESCFDGHELVKPISFFVRGNHAQFVSLAFDAGLMVHKQTDYKSNVKYHGEYLVYPSNRGVQLAEIPINFS